MFSYLKLLCIYPVMNNSTIPCCYIFRLQPLQAIVIYCNIFYNLTAFGRMIQRAGTIVQKKYNRCIPEFLYYIKCGWVMMTVNNIRGIPEFPYIGYNIDSCSR